MRTKLDEAAIRPSAEADRLTLIKRVHYDLLGLPLTPEEIDQFVADSSPKAFEALTESNLLHELIAVSATRTPAKYELPQLAKYITFGASPRATIGLIEGGRALALLRGRSYALPEDLIDLVPDVLRHRLVLSYEALAEGVTPERIIQQIMARVAPPEKPLQPGAGEGAAIG